VCQTRYKLFPRNILGCTRFTALDVRVPSFTPIEDTKGLLKITWIKSPRNHFVLFIIIKINNVYVSKCLLHCLEQTESKYVEALVHSDGLTKHSVLLVWKTLQWRKYVLCFSVKGYASYLSLIHCNRMPQWGIGFILNSILWYCDVSGCHSTGFTSPTPKSKNVRIRVFTHSNMILIL